MELLGHAAPILFIVVSCGSLDITMILPGDIAVQHQPDDGELDCERPISGTVILSQPAQLAKFISVDP